MDFSGVVGNEGAKRRLAIAIREGTLPHAFLIVGPQGSGKHTIATELAAALMCEKRIAGSEIPCHTCPSCQRVAKGQYTDVKTLKREGGKATIGVEEIRLFREDMFLSSTESEYKLYIIEEADKMTVAAQNALLKVLEEPPPNVVILLLSESPDKILITIKSRTERIAAERFDKERVKEHLLRVSEEAKMLARTNPDELARILSRADGIIGQALALLDPKRSAEREREDAVIDGILSGMTGGYAQLHAALSALPGKRAELSEFAELLLLVLRDLSLIKLDPSVGLLYFTDSGKASSIAGKLSQKQIQNAIEAILELHESVQKNANMTTILSVLESKLA